MPEYIAIQLMYLNHYMTVCTKVIQAETYLKIKIVNKGTVKPEYNKKHNRQNLHVQLGSNTRTKIYWRKIKKKITNKFRGINL